MSLPWGEGSDSRKVSKVWLLAKEERDFPGAAPEIEWSETIWMGWTVEEVAY